MTTAPIAHPSRDRAAVIKTAQQVAADTWAAWAVPTATKVPVAFKGGLTEAEAKAYANELWGRSWTATPSVVETAERIVREAAAPTYRNAERAASYGVHETNPLPDGGHDWSQFEEGTWSLRQLQDDGGKVCRLRLLTEAGYPYLDISYVHGVLPNGRMVHVQPVRSSLVKAKGSVPSRRDLVQWAKEERVYARGIGLLDEGNWSILH